MLKIVSPSTRAIYAKQKHLNVKDDVNVLWFNLEDSINSENIESILRWYNIQDNYIFLDCTKEHSELKHIRNKYSNDDNVYLVTSNPNDKKYVKNHIYWEMFLTAVKEMTPDREEVDLHSQWKRFTKKFICYNGRNRPWRRELYQYIKDRKLVLSPQHATS